MLDVLGVAEPDETVRMFVRGWIALKDEVVLSWIDRGGGPSEDELIDLLLTTLVDIVRRVGDVEAEVLRAVEADR